MTQTGSFANKILDIVTRRNLKFLKKAAAKYKLKTCELNIALRVIEKRDWKRNRLLAYSLTCPRKFWKFVKLN